MIFPGRSATCSARTGCADPSTSDRKTKLGMQTSTCCHGGFRISRECRRRRIRLQIRSNSLSPVGFSQHTRRLFRRHDRGAALVFAGTHVDSQTRRFADWNGAGLRHAPRGKISVVILNISLWRQYSQLANSDRYIGLVVCPLLYNVPSACDKRPVAMRRQRRIFLRVCSVGVET